MISETCPICDGNQWWKPPEKNIWVCKICKPPKNENTESPRCDCGSENFWRPKNKNEWRCEKCNPPASRVFVAATWPEKQAANDRAPSASKPITLAEYIVTCGMEWCTDCRGWQGRETVWSDGTSTLRCRTCGAELPPWPEVKPVEENPQPLARALPRVNQ